MKKVLTLSLLLALAPTLCLADGFRPDNRFHSDDRGYGRHEERFERPRWNRQHRYDRVAYVAPRYVPVRTDDVPPVQAYVPVPRERVEVVSPLNPVAPVLATLWLGAALTHAAFHR